MQYGNPSEPVVQHGNGKRHGPGNGECACGNSAECNGNYGDKLVCEQCSESDSKKLEAYKLQDRSEFAIECNGNDNSKLSECNGNYASETDNETTTDSLSDSETPSVTSGVGTVIHGSVSSRDVTSPDEEVKEKVRKSTCVVT